MKIKSPQSKFEIPTILGLAMGLIYLGAGSYLIYPNHSVQPISPQLSLLLGILLVAYGLFRIYRALKQNHGKNQLNIIVLLVLSISQYSCNSINRDPYSDTPTSGRIKIAVDETYTPIMESERMVFQDLYHYASIKPVYMPESEAFKLLLDDSVRFLLSSRPLSEQEIRIYRDRKIYPRQTLIASDAIALIVNPGNPDTVMSVYDVKNILTGKIRKWSELNSGNPSGNIEVVFDNQHSSTVRYARDSICTGIPLAAGLTALDSNTEVINYVAEHKEALGIIGLCWISNPNDPTHLSFLEKIRTVAISKEKHATWDNSYRPFQAYIFQNKYPFGRKVYIINTEPRNGLVTGFTAFVAGEKGQRIILKSGIVPATVPTRVVDVHNSDLLQ